jgi:hypothetical protein
MVVVPDGSVIDVGNSRLLYVYVVVPVPSVLVKT